MRRAIVVFSGFTEEWGEQTGSDALYRDLFRYRAYSGHDSLITVFKRDWHNWKELADWLNAHGYREVFVAAYSWGAGLGLKEFAKRFEGRITAVLCDPVFRSKYWWMRWRALLRKQNTIRYSDNVRVKQVFYQDIDRVGNDKVAGFANRTRLSVQHTKIDGHPAYHAAVHDEIQEWLKGSGNE